MTELSESSFAPADASPDRLPVVTRLRALRGANRWRLAPVIAGDLRPGSLGVRPLGTVPAVVTRLEALMPSVTGGAPDPAATLVELLPAIALELQRQAGTDVHFGQLVRGEHGDTRTLLVEYTEEELGLASVREALALVHACVDATPYALESVLERLRMLYERVRLDATTLAIVEEAQRRGIPVRRLTAPSLVQLGLGRALRRIEGTTSDRTSLLGARIARDVEHMRRVLTARELPTPNGGLAHTLHEARTLAAQLRYPVRVGPSIGNAEAHGADAARDGVVIDTPDALDAEWAKVTSALGLPVLVESQGAGRVHRVLVVDGRVVACAERGVGGAAAIDRTAAIHPENALACELATGALGLGVAGVDVRTPDIAVPFASNAATILAVDARPELDLPAPGGAPNAAAEAIVDLLFPPGAATTIPIIAVTGTNGKTTTTRLIAHLFGRTGATVGYTTTDGIYVADRMVARGDMTGPFSANVILANAAVDVAVLETARGGLLRGGIGFDACDVAVVLNVTADHLGLRGIETIEDLAAIKGIVPAVARSDGHAVLNADDPLVRAMRDRTHATIAFFSTATAGSNAEFEAHLAQGGIGALIDDEHFVVVDGPLRTRVARVGEVPLMLGGAARFQAQNVLAAILAAYTRGLPIEQIRGGVLSFVPSPGVTPGRLNVLRFGERRVIIDYAHNAAAVTGLIDFVQRLEARRRIGVVTGPGDRRDEDLRTLGRLTSVLDHVILKEDENGRGRPRGEIAGLIREGLLEGGLPVGEIEIVFDEYDAIRHAIAQLEDGDIAFMMVNDVQGVLDLLRTMGATS